MWRYEYDPAFHFLHLSCAHPKNMQRELPPSINNLLCVPPRLRRNTKQEHNYTPPLYQPQPQQTVHVNHLGRDTSDEMAIKKHQETLPARHRGAFRNYIRLDDA